jgi:hypothetical protein
MNDGKEPMSIAPDYKRFDGEDLLFDRETWPIGLEKALCDHPDTAESLIRCAAHPDRGGQERAGDGIARASNKLMDGVEWAYLHIDARRSALKLYLLYLEGRLLRPG